MGGLVGSEVLMLQDPFLATLGAATLVPLRSMA